MSVATNAETKLECSFPNRMHQQQKQIHRRSQPLPSIPGEVSDNENPRLQLLTSTYWRGYSFCPKINEFFDQVGWQATCTNCDHGRCVRTLNFRKHHGQLNVEKMLKFWCLASEHLTTKHDHLSVEFPDPLPALDVLESLGSARDLLVEMGARGLYTSDRRKRQRQN